MNKEEFLSGVKEKLEGLPPKELEESLAYYREMIEDRMEDGMQEEEAVAAMGSVEEAASQILDGMSLPKLVKAKVKLSRTLRAWEIALLIAGSPVWVPLLVCIVLVFFTFYVVVASLLFTIHALNLALAVAGIAGIASAILQFATNRALGGGLTLGAAIFSAGASVLLFLGSRHVDKAFIHLAKRFGIWIKSLFLRRFEAMEQLEAQKGTSI